ncbi:hypothetical protein PAXRUDRAFT_483111 [Paxillus rubicundulus Ve08.2h10]|uniref:Uncharacterized protein n=1 Tax=Paxillus rubicundulus Ve08.2h10 TaxID=930991 RepID=A0A0D0ECM4_9AGAM|nr:hypothetical protein PAXRUDRAFT_483111 [Paxillus rubicundulus Ve08.2h10]
MHRVEAYLVQVRQSYIKIYLRITVLERSARDGVNLNNQLAPSVMWFMTSIIQKREIKMCDGDE